VSQNGKAHKKAKKGEKANKKEIRLTASVGIKQCLKSGVSSRSFTGFAVEEKP